MGKAKKRRRARKQADAGKAQKKAPAAPIPTRVALSPRFKRDFRKSPKRRQAGKALELLTRDRSHPGLHLEKIGKDVWSIRTNGGWRILLREMEDQAGKFFLATRLEDHDVYKKR